MSSLILHLILCMFMYVAMRDQRQSTNAKILLLFLLTVETNINQLSKFISTSSNDSTYFCLKFVI